MSEHTKAGKRVFIVPGLVIEEVSATETKIVTGGTSVLVDGGYDDAIAEQAAVVEQAQAQAQAETRKGRGRTTAE